MNGIAYRRPCRDLDRRHFLKLTTLTMCGLAAGCAVNPVTGKNQLMFLSEADEINLDRENNPHQFSADYGRIQDDRLNAYIQSVGASLASISHRPQMPYSFQCVNAVYINAYAFPGGSIAATRGILLGLKNEAELAALLGHEIGHVNARHTARQMTKSMAAMVVVAGLTAYVAYEKEKYAPLAAGLGYVGAGLLLARYSRDNEREADSLGLEYMVKSGYNPAGFVGLMDMLQNLTHEAPGRIQILFSTHPMSQERYETAVARAHNAYPDARDNPVYVERYMDETDRLRASRSTIETLQNGEESMLNEKFKEAESQFRKAVKISPSDYAGWVMLSKCLLAEEKYSEALNAANEAIRIYPGEAQAHHIAGVAMLNRQNFGAAFQAFDDYEKRLPGNPNTVFFKGFSMELASQRQKSADEYLRYLNQAPSGEFSEHAKTRLIEWGYISTPTPAPASDQ